MKLSEFKKLIREEIRKALTESKITKTKKHKLRENTQKRVLNEVDVNPDPNDEISGSPGFNFDKFAKQSPVVLFSEYEGDWMEENEDWPDDFVPFQNYLYAKYVDGTDFALMVGMGDDIFNALAIKNPKVIQDPTVKKYIKKIMSYGGLEFEKGKKIMSYGGLEFEKGKLSETRKGLKEATGKAFALVIDEDGNFLQQDLSSYFEEAGGYEEPTKLAAAKVAKFPTEYDAWANAPELAKAENAKWVKAVAALSSTSDFYDVLGDGGENAFIAAVPKGSDVEDYMGEM